MTDSVVSKMSVAKKIQEKFSDGFVSCREALGETTVEVKREHLLAICRFLHDDPETDFSFITDICSVDFPDQTPRFQMVYHFYSIDKNQRIRIKTGVPEEDCTVDSITSIWKGANFLEREVFDMMGIRFNNHPDLRRILMTEDYDEGFPLRKDFPVEGRGWRDTFEFMAEGAS